VHESPLVMLVPLLLLAVGAVFAGAVFAPSFIGHHWEEFWNGAIVNAPGNEIMHHVHEVPGWVPLAPTIVGLGGIALAYVMYMFAPSLPGALARAFPGVHRFLLNKWWFDELYDRIFVRPSFALGMGFWKKGDAAVIDGLGADGLAANTLVAARRMSALQTGYVYHYAFAMLVGVALLASWFIVGGGQ
jgi:NADH-quinone oxidoreductase subunit L